MKAIQATMVLLAVTGAVLLFNHYDVFAHGDKPQLENLLRTQLEGVEGTEVIVSRVTLPPHSTLPKHTHPGEEFAYVLEGTVTLWQEGKDEIVFKAGEVGKVSLNQVHTAITAEEGATILVFRVHETGKPERTLVE